MDNYREFIALETKTEDLKSPEMNLIKEFQNEQYRYAVVYYTDKVEVIELQEEPVTEILDIDKILEVRIFGEQGEYYLIRNLDGSFVGRVIQDKPVVSEDNKDGWEKKEVFDELHKLWDKCYPNRTDKNKLVFVRVRNYFNVEGSLEFCDWRFVNFEVFEKTEFKRGGE